jgi:hypothetical protein
LQQSFFYSVANGRKHATESLKSVRDYFLVFRKLQTSWLLNYRGGSFVTRCSEIRKECQIRGVSFEVLSDSEEARILDEISSPSQNMETVILEKAPRIAVYTLRETTLG